MGSLNQQSSNSLFGGDSTSVPVKVGPNKNNFTNVVADDADDDWDKEDSPVKSNPAAASGAAGGMGFFNRAPAQQPITQYSNQLSSQQAKSSTMN
jgi:hypothetical protein